LSISAGRRALEACHAQVSRQAHQYDLQWSCRTDGKNTHIHAGAVGTFWGDEPTVIVKERPSGKGCKLFQRVVNASGHVQPWRLYSRERLATSDEAIHSLDTRDECGLSQDGPDVYRQNGFDAALR
jgi:hypothetical protein